MQVTFKGQAKELIGNQPKVGDMMPNAKLYNGDNQAVELKSLVGKPLILSVVPDIETRVCELQTKIFNDKTQEKDYQFITVSKNTPEQFNKWNEEMELGVSTLSDTDNEFAKAFGLEIDEIGLLSRSVFVIDQTGKIVYEEIVPEVTDEPSYKEAIAAADAL